MTHDSDTPAVRSWEHPECPKCESEVFVDAVDYDTEKYACRFCDMEWSE